jgi:O-acetyl-ADP-ribose deacetylase (regulator of RNase III)
MPAIEYRVGNLFHQSDLTAWGHGVNTHGVMGAGIAVPFRQTFSNMYRTYRTACQNGTLNLGEVMPYFDLTTNRWVYNLVSQDTPGADARLYAVERSLRLASQHAATHDVYSLGLPLIGCGIGGLRWKDVRKVFETVAQDSALQLVVVSFEPVEH